MKQHTMTTKFFSLLMALLVLFGCIAMGETTVAASAATVDSTYVHFATGKLRDYAFGTYTGDMVNGMPHGIGVIEYDFGAIFIGNFSYGEPDGYGIYYYYEEDTYVEGDWSWDTCTAYLDTEREGGEMTYTGMFCDGKANGMGELTLENCGTFYGEFQDGNVDGWGIYAYKTPIPEKEPLIDGTDWEMVWGSKKHSHTYNGLSLDGKWQGFGLGVMSSGSHYVGEIRNEYRHGYGRLYLSGNRLYQEGTFKNGTLVK